MAKIVQYNPLDTLIPYRVTFYDASANTPDYIGLPNTLINPDITGVQNIESKYWKYNSATSSLNLMSQAEIDALEDSLPKQKDWITIPPLTQGHDLVIDENRNIITRPPKDVQKMKSTEEWATNDTEWEQLDDLTFTSRNYDTADYEVRINMNCYSTSNKGEFTIGLFVDDVLVEDTDSVYFFDKKEDTKSITIITYAEAVPIDSIINVKIKRISNKNSYITIGRRTFIIEEK